MNNEQQTDHPSRWVQLPIRLEASLADALDRSSKATRIPKSEIARSSIRRFINDLERSGVRTALEGIHSA
jgi:hypothetical protein